MVSFGGLRRTFAVTKNPATALFSKFTKKRAKIIFKNGNNLELTWEQFTYLRDHYGSIKAFEIRNFENNTYHMKNAKFQFIGSPIIMCLIDELETGMYDCDYKGKVVLDIGGFQGESAVFFSKMGAKKIIVYEPVLANHRFIECNVRLNQVNAEIHNKGVADKDGVVIVNYENADNCFGILENGRNKMEINVRNIENVIEESGADIAKIDCEGAEKYLVDIPADTLRKIEFYMIEAHSAEIKKALIVKFRQSGFILSKGDEEPENISVVQFRRQN